ncbi:MAG: FAD-dependent oxidoreductase [Planctomycetota bacterium]
MPAEREAIVIGGGLIGCSSAFYLAQHGWRVRLLERDTIGAGASSGNCGYICPSHVQPLAVPGAISQTLKTMARRDSPVAVTAPWRPSLIAWLMRFALACRAGKAQRAARGRHALLASSNRLYRELLTGGGLNAQLQDRGLLVAYRHEGPLDRFASTAEMLRGEFGVEVNKLAGAELQDFEPALRDDLAGAWFFPGDADVEPYELLHALVDRLSELGVAIEEGVSVESLEVTGGKLRRLVTNRGDFTAETVVVAAGAETPRFAGPLRCRIPIQPGRGYSLVVDNPVPAPARPIIFEESHVAVTPMAGGMKIGSTMEFAGYNRKPNPARVALLRESTRQHLRGEIGEPRDPVWVGWRPMVYDGVPCIDFAPGASNVIVAAGNGMIGLATAPATGRLVAELASGAEPHIDPAPYSLRRF